MAIYSQPKERSATLGGAATAGEEPRRSADVSGTPTERPVSLGPPIDPPCWRATALELLRRLPPFPGAGEGPLPKAVDAMANYLPQIVAPIALRAALDEEAYLRAVFRLPTVSTNELREAIVQTLAQVLTPAVNALGGAAAQSPIASTAAPPTLGPPARAGAPMSRRPSLIRLCPDTDHRFEQARDWRIASEGNVAGALGRGKTWEDVDRAVPREDTK